MPEFFWPRGFAARLVRAALLLSICMAATSARAQNASIGLYSDASGNSCSFSGDAPGYVTAYVVVRPDPRGVTAVQFAAPLPACYGATYLYDQAASAALVLGNSQTGVSVALSQCVDDPVNVLQIVYYQTGGATASCCPYPIIPDPALETLSASDCAFQDLPIAGVTSHMNADASCACLGNSAPYAPSNPFPQDNTAGSSTRPFMNWYADDVDGNLVDYDIYIGTTPSPPLVASHLSEPNYVPAALAPFTQHYWRVVARDALGLESSGPVWAFTTRASNTPPFPPESPHPISGQSGVQLNATLFWGAGDIDNDVLTFDVYLGTSPNPPLVAEDVLQPEYTPGVLAPDTPYYWRVVASDGLAETSGPTWTFTTREANGQPVIPYNPNPVHGADNVSLDPGLTWSCFDPDADPLTFDVYFGTDSNPPLAGPGLTTRSYDPGTLLPNTSYFWRVMARDPLGAQSDGPVWTFRTRANNSPPNPAFNPSPPNGGIAFPLSVLTWSSTDPNGDPLTHVVYFGTTTSPPAVAADWPSRSYAPGTLTVGMRYYWRIDVFDGANLTIGPLWSFTVVPGGTGDGDVNGDGSLTVDDAQCALQLAVGAACGGTGSDRRADVDCNSIVTPRDARCIHKQAVDGSCTFCGGAAAAAPANPTTPTVFAYPTWAEGDTLITQVFASGIPSLQSFAFTVSTDPTVSFIRASRIGATLGWEALAVYPAPIPVPIPIPWSRRIGAYTLSGVPANFAVAVLELRFVLPQGTPGYARLSYFVDDFAGANDVVIPVNRDGGPTPVLITRFEAVRAGSAVEVSWNFSSDEPMATYTLYRRDAGAATPVVVAQGPADDTRSFVDRGVEPSTTYHYDLVVRTREGSEYRSPTATVTTAALTLALGQNHPNPFNPQTTIPFDVPAASRVRLFVLDTSGRVVRTLVDQTFPAGSHAAVWDGKDRNGGSVSSGVYFCVLDVDGQRMTRKMVLLK